MTGDAFVEQGEADDAVFTTAHNAATHALYLVAADGEGTDTEGWQLDGLHLSHAACRIF